MDSIVIDKRFCGPPNSGNGGYVCGLLAKYIEGSAEITLRAPPPLDRPLDVVQGADGGVELREQVTLLATGRPAPSFDVGDIPAVTFPRAEEAASNTPFKGSNHPLPRCFVCGPMRAHGDGLRIIPGPLSRPSGEKQGILASPWIPHSNLSDDDDLVAPEFIWAALDCPTGFAGGSARHLGLNGGESTLLGRMSARIDRRPRPGERCVILAWPTGRDGRKLFADSALSGPEGEVLAISRTTWIIVDQSPEAIRYARVVPGMTAGTIAVEILGSANGATRVRVTYDLTALTAAGSTWLEAFAEHYETGIGEWSDEIDAALQRAG